MTTPTPTPTRPLHTAEFTATFGIDGLKHLIAERYRVPIADVRIGVTGSGLCSQCCDDDCPAGSIAITVTVSVPTPDEHKLY